MAGQAIVTIRDRQWQAYLATTYEELTAGLKGLPSIPPGTGMFFVLPQEQAVSVTTQGLYFPIDVIFISGQLEVVSVAGSVSPNMLVTEGTPVRYFLEVNAGEVAEAQVGDEVIMSLMQPVAAAGSYDFISPVVTFAGVMMIGSLMVKMGQNMAKAAFPKKTRLYGPRGERLLPQTKYKLYQRGADGYPVGVDPLMRKAWGPIPDTEQPFWSDKGFIKPVKIYGWQYSPDYHRWRAYVRFPDGTEIWTDPREYTLWEKEELLTQTRKRKPARNEVEIGSWAERDRIGIWLTDKRTDKTIAEWWDEDARQMFEDGFFKPGDIRHQTISGGAFEESVLDYAESVGLLAKQTQPAIIPAESVQPRPGKPELEFLPDSPEYLAYTIEDIGYREKIDRAFESALARVKGR